MTRTKTHLPVTTHCRRFNFHPGLYLEELFEPYNFKALGFFILGIRQVCGNSEMPMLLSRINNVYPLGFCGRLAGFMVRGYLGAQLVLTYLTIHNLFKAGAAQLLTACTSSHCMPYEEL